MRSCQTISEKPPGHKSDQTFFFLSKKLLFFTFALKQSLWVWLLSKITKFGNWIYFTVILDVYDVLINRYITMANLMHNLTVEKSYKLAWITVQNASSACAWNLVKNLATLLLWHHLHFSIFIRKFNIRWSHEHTEIRTHDL